MIILENKSLCVEFEEKEQRIVITDKRIEKIWKQVPFPDFMRLTEIETGPVEGEINFHFTGKVLLRLTVALEHESELLWTLSASPDTPFESLAFPPAILPPDSKHYILETDSEGLLLPVDDCGYPLEQQPIFRCSGGPGMAWLGMVDGALESGFMTIYETPYDAEVLLEKKDGLICFSTVWLSSLGNFSYDRRIRTVFFEKGGYVAQCKRYRRYAWEKNHVTSLKSKLDRFPSMEKMLGAVHVYVWDDGRKRELLEEMKESGIEKALILWNSNHLPYPDQEFTSAVKALGYGIGNQELFTDIHPDSPKRLERKKQIPLLLNCYPGKFEFLTAKTKNGGTYSNQFGTYVCPAAIREEMKKRIEMTLARYPQETLFLDVYQANGLYECYDDRHPLTREGYANAILDNMGWIEDTYGMYLGSEFGADFAAGHGTYVYGMMTLQRTWFNSEATVPGSIYYIGDWKNGRRPTIMLSSRTATLDYHKYSINEYTRVPLYELVYHDAVVTSWRWEDCNHHYPEIWWKKDLFNMLYGNVPLWSIDQSCFTSYKNTFLKSYQKVVPWVGSVCFDEMTDHRFLSDDHKVQQTVFSSGKSIIVNFGSHDYICKGKRILARDCIFS